MLASNGDPPNLSHPSSYAYSCVPTVLGEMGVFESLRSAWAKPCFKKNKTKKEKEGLAE
jgi:hypothetical protein